MRLPFTSREEWVYRWLVLPSWGRLHRVRRLSNHGRLMDGEGIRGRTVCGRRGKLIVPGFMSRLGLPRCTVCCKRLGVARGDGAPCNKGIDA